MSRSKHLWSDPAPEVEWEVWSEDTFDREARPTMDTRGRSLLDGLAALWMRFLLETVRPEGFQGFTRFYLRRPDVAGARITGPWQGAVRLRQWVFGTEKREIQDNLEAADRWLFEAIISAHGGLLLEGQSSEPILAIAAEAESKQEFEARISELALSGGLDLSQVSRQEARRLAPLVYSAKGVTQQGSKMAPSPKNSEKRRKAAASTKKSRLLGGYKLLGAAAFLFIGLAILFVTGLGSRLTCDRAEPSLLECRHETRWMGLITIGSQQVEGLWRARVGQVCDEGGCSQFPELDTATGPIRLDGVPSSELGLNQEIVDQINGFLSGTDERTLEVSPELRPGRLVVPLGLMLVGIGFLGAWLTDRLGINKL